MQIKRFDPGHCKLAAPQVSPLPTFSRASLQRRPASPVTNARLPTLHRYLRSRYALTEAYRQSGVGPTGALLAPSYHCRTMLDPALRLGAECHLYPLCPDLTVDVAWIDALLEGAKGQVKAVLATHFFGFTQDLRALSDCCKRHGVSLIEDCSHVLPSPEWEAATGSLGRFGRYSVWSPYKFFPCEDGGYLQVNGDEALSPKLLPMGLLGELKGLVRLLRRSRKRDSATELVTLDSMLGGEGADFLAAAGDLDEFVGTPSADYVCSQEGLAMSRLSQWIVNHADEARVRDRRRQRYLQWLEVARDWPGCTPLHSELPADCVPYMFPLHVPDPQTQFLPLKRIGVPIWRWDGMAVSDCPVATDYRLHMFQMPCHQELNDREMAWMLAAMSKVLAA